MSNFKDSDSGSNVDSIRNRIKYGTPFQAFKGIFIEYFKESSIHGFKYVGEQKRSALDRIIWLCIVILSIITCAYLINNIWNKRNQNLVVVNLDGRLTPVWAIPFPMITICPRIKIHHKMFNFTERPTNITEDVQYHAEIVRQLCTDYELYYYDNYTFKNPIPNASKLIEIMSNVAPLGLFYGCSWRGKLVPCHHLFDPVLTQDGICFSFNSFKSEYYRNEFKNSRPNVSFDNYYYFDKPDRNIEWDLEHGYNDEALRSLKAYPFHSAGAGATESLQLYIVNEYEVKDNNCGNYENHIKLTVQTPGEEPQVSKNFNDLASNHHVSVTIKPQIMTTSERLRHYTPERRQCYYQYERNLRYFTKYTQANCELECLANQTLAKCGCVKFSMPRTSSHPVCGIRSLFCTYEVANDFASWKFMAMKKPYIENASCNGNCLPTCFDVKYKAEIEQVPLARNVPYFQVTALTVNFDEDVFNNLIRSEVYSKTDFIADCGGLLGLFMGVSILSLVELVYYLTVRLWLNLKERRRINAGGIKKEIKEIA